ncbi:hypothetical protein L218DRAFT_944295 [Marasmius fiardii PR-910]|nr:hypothetical protein L218DRAFT_944295 [Marasmius fiardii PR-910]
MTKNILQTIKTHIVSKSATSTSAYRGFGALPGLSFLIAKVDSKDSDSDSEHTVSNFFRYTVDSRELVRKAHLSPTLSPTVESNSGHLQMFNSGLRMEFSIILLVWLSTSPPSYSLLSSDHATSQQRELPKSLVNWIQFFLWHDAKGQKITRLKPYIIIAQEVDNITPSQK